jgi:hypothetical protein
MAADGHLKTVISPFTATLARRRERAGADCVHPMARAAQARANHRLDRTTRWTFASELATVHPVAGQPRPVGCEMR